MAAINLLYVVKDGVFNCYDQLIGFTKKQYTLLNAPVKIDDALAADCILVLASHCNANAKVTLGKESLSVSDYADRIRGSITNAAKITKVVHFICWAGTTVKARPGYDQLSAADELTLTPAGLIVTGKGNTVVTPADAVKLSAAGNGWTFTPRAA